MSFGAKTVIERATSASLNIIFEDWYTGAVLAYKTICSSAHIEHGNARVDVYVTTNDTGSEVEVWADITVQAGANTDTDNVLLAILSKSSFPYRPSTNNLPVSIPVTFELTGLYLREEHTETPERSEGGVVHPAECTLAEEWSWEEGATQTVTCGAATATCDVSEEAGVVDLFDDFFDVVFYASATCVQAGAAVTFGSITCGDVAVRTDQCDQDSDATYASGRGWTTNDGGDYTAAGTGSSITLSGNTTSAANVWRGWVKQPRAVNFSNVYVRKFLGDIDSFDSAVVNIAGLTDPDGDPWSDTVADLRALGTVVTPDCYSWIAANAGEIPPYVAWTGWKPGATIALTLDETWLRSQVEHQSNEDLDDTWMILDCHALDAVNRTDAPHFRSVFEMAHVASVNVIDPPTTAERDTAYRPADWVGSGGLTVDAADNDLWTVRDLTPWAPSGDYPVGLLPVYECVNANQWCSQFACDLWGTIIEVTESFREAVSSGTAIKYGQHLPGGVARYYPRSDYWNAPVGAMLFLDVPEPPGGDDIWHVGIIHEHDEHGTLLANGGNIIDGVGPLGCMDYIADTFLVDSTVKGWIALPANTDPEATVDLVDIRIDRLTAIKAAAASGYAASGLPEGYLYTAANRDENYPEPADGKTRENPTYWACYRFARFALNVPVACTLEVRIDYDEITISDSHVTGSQRLEDLEWTFLPRIVSYSLPFATTGSQTVDVDLLAGAEELEGAKFHRVRKVTISGFPTDAEREFEFESLTLIEHPDHSFCYCKRVDPWTYTEVGFSAVIDGAVNALALPDNFHQNVEDGLGVIRWSIDAATGTDQSGAFLLTDLVNILNNLEGLTCTWDSSDWDTHTLDVDGVRLCSPWPWHLIEAEARDEADPGTDDWDWHMAIRVRLISIVRGLVYNLYSNKILEGGLHGGTFSGGALADGVTVYVWKRAVGETIWTSAGSCTSNDLGYYSIGSLRVLASQGATYEDDVLYQYGVSLTNDADAVTLVGSGHQREWIARRVLGLPLWYPNLDIDAGGVIWVAAANGAGRVYVGYMDPKDTEPHWVTLPWGGAAGYAWPAIACCDDGSLLVAATIDGGMVIQRSRDRGAAWSAVMADLGSTYEYGDICQRNGVTYCCGWESDHVRFAASSETDLSEEALAVGVTELDVCDAAVAEGAEKPRSSIVVADDRGVVVAVSQDGDLRFYRCRSYSAGFSEVVSA